MKKIAFMFPGQGSQSVGMGKDIYDTYENIRPLYDLANDVLQKNIKNLMFTGSKEELTETENAQPALLLSSIVIKRLLDNEQIVPTMTIGHSLGEYSALVASGSLSLEEALPLVTKRGQLMEKAYPKGKGTMNAVLGLSDSDIKGALSALSDEDVVDIANLNCPGQVVISGTKEGINHANELLSKAGARRILPLNVSGPFHSRLMKPANETFLKHLNEVTIHDATIPVYANVSAEPVRNKEEIKELLIKQLYSPVRFEESIRNIITKGIDGFVEVGNGRVLAGLVKKIDRTIPVFSVQDPTSIKEFIAWYKGDS